jgi:hypothetical protein
MKAQTQNMSRKAKVKKNGAKLGQTGGKKNCSNIFIMTALTTNYGHM